ncbi:MAG TPA: glyoxylate/hydroxypyruvate reductase A [Propylenella sp.]
MKPALLVATKGWDVESWARRIRPLLPEHPILCTERSGLYPGPDADLAAVGYLLAWKPLQETIDRLPALKVIFSLGAGVDHIFALPRLPDVPVARIVDRDLTARMTEYVVWQVLDHLRRGAAYRRNQRQRRWHELPQPAAHQVTVGIMGLGVMGARAAAMLLRLGFPVRAWTRSPKDADGVEVFTGADGLRPFLGGTDILVSLLPLTGATRGLIDKDVLNGLRRDGPLGGPVFINAGRGGCHVEADIVAALKDGTLAGASLDVFEREPLAADSPLWEFENVAITPHLAAVSDPEALAGQIAGQILAFERGEPLRNRVDPGRGY